MWGPSGRTLANLKQPPLPPCDRSAQLRDATRLRKLTLSLPACPPALAATLAYLPCLESADLDFTGTPSPGSWPQLAALGSRLSNLSIGISYPAWTAEDAERQEGLVAGLDTLAQLPRLTFYLLLNSEEASAGAHLQGLGSLPALSQLVVTKDRTGAVHGDVCMPPVMWDSHWRHTTRLTLCGVDLEDVDDTASLSHRSASRMSRRCGVWKYAPALRWLACSLRRSAAWRSSHTG